MLRLGRGPGAGNALLRWEPLAVRRPRLHWPCRASQALLRMPSRDGGQDRQEAGQEHFEDEGRMNEPKGGAPLPRSPERVNGGEIPSSATAFMECFGKVLRDFGFSDRDVADVRAAMTKELRTFAQSEKEPSWIAEELKDGDRICEAAGVQRTEGGRLPVAKIINLLGRPVPQHRSGGPVHDGMPRAEHAHTDKKLSEKVRVLSPGSAHAREAPTQENAEVEKNGFDTQPHKAAPSRMPIYGGDMQTEDPDELLDTPQTADILDVKPGTLEVWRATKRYPLPFIKIGGKVRYRRSDVLRFIEANKVTP